MHPSSNSAVKTTMTSSVRGGATTTTMATATAAGGGVVVGVQATASRRQSDAGGELQPNSVGANVRVMWRTEELALLHFAAIHVPWSFVGRMRDAAEKNEKNGMMTVDLAELKGNGKPLFGDDFNTTFKDVFVRRFIPCVNEKFNARGDDHLTKLPDDVSEAYRLLVLSELLKAAIKEDVKANLDKLVRSSPPNSSTRPTDTAVYQIILSSILYFHEPAPSGSLQEHVISRAIEILAGGLPDTLNALEELVQLSCSKGRHEMNALIFRITAEKAMGVKVAKPVATAPPPSAKKHTQDPTHNVVVLPAAQGPSKENQPLNDQDEKERYLKMQQEIRKQQDDMHLEIEKLNQLRLEIAREKELLTAKQAAFAEREGGGEQQQQQQLPMVAGASKPMNRTASHINVSAELNGEASTPMNTDVGLLALRQGLILEKVCKNSSERIVRISGEVLEWRKPGASWSDVRKVSRGDIVNIKVVDPTHRTFLLSTRTGLLTLRALSKQSCAQWVSAIESWVKEAPYQTSAQQRRRFDESAVMNGTGLHENSHIGMTSPGVATPLPRPSTGSRRFSLERISVAFGGIPLLGLAGRNSVRQQNTNANTAVSTANRTPLNAGPTPSKYSR